MRICDFDNSGSRFAAQTRRHGRVPKAEAAIHSRRPRPRPPHGAIEDGKHARGTRRAGLVRSTSGAPVPQNLQRARPSDQDSAPNEKNARKKLDAAKAIDRTKRSGSGAETAGSVAEGERKTVTI